FARVIETGNFTAVARELGVSQPTISKRVAAAEDYFGCRLFSRTTRKLHPTTDAVRLYEHVRRVLDALEIAEAQSGRPREEPAGELRIAAPSSFTRTVLIPKLERFRARYPLVRLDLHLSEQVVDLIAEGMELGIRIGELPSSSLVARRVASVDRRIVAAECYLAGRAAPRMPEDLVDHDCITYTGFKPPERWVFDSDFGRRAIDVSGALAIDNADAIAEAVKVGLGVALLPSWLLSREVTEGEVRVLLPDFTPTVLPIHVIYSDRRWLSLRARSFITFLVEEFSGGRARESSAAETGVE
ncbi:MAG: LysR substrate-binding domain-containing protein, partial [Bauldia litoralis]